MYRTLIQSTQFKKIYLKIFGISYVENLQIMNVQDMFRYMEGGGSIVRFGDGEFLILNGTGSPAFQQFSKELQKSLFEVFNSNLNNLLVCIPSLIKGGACAELLTTDATYYWSRFLVRHKDWLERNIDHERTYGDTEISRPWIDFLNKKHSMYIFESFKQLFKDRNIVIIEGRYTHFGSGNDLLSGAKSISRILGPERNAYGFYKQIVKFSSVLPKSSLVIVSLGPAGKVITYELVKLGYQVLDLGHLDIEYEWYLRGAQNRCLVSGKYVNETEEKMLFNKNFACYEEQVIKRIYH